MDTGAKARDFVQEFFHVIGRIILVILKALGIVVGVLLTIVGIALIAGFVASFTGHKMVIDNEQFSMAQLQMFVDHILGKENFILFAIAVFLVAIIPICGILWLGLKLIFRFKSGGRYFWLTALATWLLSIIVIIVFAVSFARNFARESSRISGMDVKLNQKSQLYLKTNSDFRRVEGKEFSFSGKRDREYSLVVDKEIFGRPRLIIEQTENKESTVNIEWKSYGRNHADADNNTQSIIYNVSQKDSLLRFDPYYIIPQNQKWRAQDVEVEVRIPNGTIIFLDASLENILYRAETENNEWIGNMVGQSWIMTEKGLVPLK
jgi:hypothetical protein